MSFCCRLSTNTSFCTESKECLEYELVCKTDEYEVSESSYRPAQTHIASTPCFYLSLTACLNRCDTTPPLAGFQQTLKPTSWEWVRPWLSGDFSSTSLEPTKQVHAGQREGGKGVALNRFVFYQCVCVCVWKGSRWRWPPLYWSRFRKRLKCGSQLFTRSTSRCLQPTRTSRLHPLMTRWAEGRCSVRSFFQSWLASLVCNDVKPLFILSASVCDLNSDFCFRINKKHWWMLKYLM